MFKACAVPVRSCNDLRDSKQVLSACANHLQLSQVGRDRREEVVRAACFPQNLSSQGLCWPRRRLETPQQFHPGFATAPPKRQREIQPKSKRCDPSCNTECLEK